MTSVTSSEGTSRAAEIMGGGRIRGWSVGQVRNAETGEGSDPTWSAWSRSRNQILHADVFESSPVRVRVEFTLSVARSAFACRCVRVDSC